MIRICTEGEGIAVQAGHQFDPQHSRRIVASASDGWGKAEPRKRPPVSGAHDGDLLTMPRPWPAPEACSADFEHLMRVLQSMHCWTPLDVEARLDDVADALDDLQPAPNGLPDLVQRLMAHLEQLEHIALANGACERNTRVAGLVTRSQALRAAAPTAAQIRGELRRAGWVVSELVDCLVEIRCLKGPAPLT